MKVSQFVFFLAALTGAASDLFFKKHVYVNTPINWSGARDYCRENYVDLSIIDTLEEYNRFKSQVAPNAGVPSWIGLNKNLSESKYTWWCDGTMLNFTSWGSGQPSRINGNCISTQNNVWSEYFCIYPLAFFCYSEVIVVVVEEMKTWDEASQHCRTYYTDLISVTTETDLLVVNNLKLKVTTSSFWTGLRFVNDLWIWVNKDPAVNQVSLPSCPNQPFSCGARNVVTNTWENRDCREKMYFICYRQGRV